MSGCQTGDRINNYILDELLGTGSFGQVWRAKHHVFDEVVAIKVPTDPQFVRNLQREGIAIHGLKHPNIVRALDLDPYADPPYLIIEYVDGPTLRAAIDDHPQGLPLAAVENVMRGALSGLTAAHQADIVHRDLKPANIMLAIGQQEIDAIQPEQVRIGDFGLGKAGGLTTASIMQSGSLRTADGKSISGTIAYMSPEQRDGKDIDLRSDLYSLGIVLFEMLTGGRPQGQDLPSDIRAHIPPWMDRFFQKCYTRIERRYQSADDMLVDLDTADRSTPPTSPGPIPICPECSKGTTPGDQFCIHCGAQLVDELRRCPSCEAYAQQTDNFCIICGTELRVSI